MEQQEKLTNKKTLINLFIMDNPVRIVLVEDDETIRNGYAYLLNNQDGFTVVKTYSSLLVSSW